MEQLVLVTGQPGVGKTTLARALGALLGLPVLSKDDFKDALLASDGAEDPAASARLSARAFEMLYAAAAGLPAALLESNFGPTAAPALRALHPRPVEVFCHCDPDIALARFRARARHPGHFDDEMAAEIERRLRFEQRALALGVVIEVDTTHEVEFDAVASAVRAAVAEPR